MNSFFKLCEELKEESDPIRKRRFLAGYFSSCDPDELDVALFYLNGKKEKGIFREEEFISLVAKFSGKPSWLIQSSIQEVGDFAEALALLTENSSENKTITLLSIRKIAEEIRSILSTRPASESSERIREILFSFWNSAVVSEKIFLHRILLGKQILKIPDSILLSAIADCFDLEIAILFEKTNSFGAPWKSFSFLKTLTNWFPDRGKLIRLSKTEIQNKIDPSLHVEWNKVEAGDFPEENSLKGHSYFLIPENGRLVQVVLNSFGTAVWTRESYIYQKEISETLEGLFSSMVSKEFTGPDPLTLPILLLGWLIEKDSEKAFVFYDILRYKGEDLFKQTISRRSEILNSLFRENSPRVGIAHRVGVPVSDSMSGSSNANRFRQEILGENSEAFIFDPQGSRFFSIKPALKSVKAVLLYGRKAMNEEGFSFWELSFGLRKDGEDSPLVTIARTSVGSEDSLFAELDLFFKENTIEKKGPIRGVPTIWKVELLFQSRVESKRHKIGFYLQDVSIGKRIGVEEEIDHLDLLLKM
ncbi:hypothetical protein [Leptospira barantonii]|uniref:ATP-dependent DNA ligase family profile domain-containing protein n=1 Tax=Leptospira barantonii TaxID=2023184 RepID=A0ABX4NNY7_9LEPT|nr:hypothetical protein [Leptospira barantonii]PJZ58546.1 hypothetical protein CH367_00365 [Leptospira barantonii]